MKTKMIFLAAGFYILAMFFIPAKQKAFAQTAMSSATLSAILPSKIQEEKDTRAQILQDYLKKYNSPLAPFAKNFIDEADKNKIDWRLVTAISGVESYFGQMIPYNSYNGWGFGIYGNNVRRFPTWEEAITTISKALREDYMNKWKAKNVYEIGEIYATDPQWAYKVNRFMEEIEKFQKNYVDTTLSISL